VRAVELKTAGYTYAQVANELGYTSRGTAYNVVAKALRDQTATAVSGLRDLENTRLDALQLTLWDAAITGNVKAVNSIVRIVQARVRLNGLAACSGWLRGHTSHTPDIGRASSSLTWRCRVPWVSWLCIPGHPDHHDRMPPAGP